MPALVSQVPSKLEDLGLETLRHVPSRGEVRRLMAISSLSWFCDPLHVGGDERPPPGRMPPENWGG